MRTGNKNRMDNYKKQAAVWIITIAVAIAVFANANSVATEEREKSPNERFEVETEAKIEVEVETEAETEVETEVEVETEPEMEAEAEPEIMGEPQVAKWSGYDFVPGTYVTGKQADTCALYQDNTIISVIDESTKAITLANGETFEYLYADISHVTSYCACVKCCDIYSGYTYSGRNLLEEATPKVLAADFARYPLGTKIFVPGYGIAVVEDCGGAIDDRDLDVYIPDHEAAWNWGSVDMLVYIISFGQW